MWKKFAGASVVVVLALAVGGYFWLGYSIRKGVDNYLQNQVTDGKLEAASYESLDFSLSGEFNLHKLQLKKNGIEFVIDEIHAKEMDLGSRVPHYLDVQMNGLRILQGFEYLEPQGDLAMFGHWLFEQELIPVQVNYRYNYSEENAHEIITAMDITIPEYIVLSANGSLRNLPLDAFDGINKDNSDPTQVQARLIEIITDAEIPGFELSLQDLGAIGKYVETSAGAYNVEPEVMRNLLVSQARNAYLFAPAMIQNVAQDAGTQVADFLAGGKTLSLSIAPQFNGSVRQLQPQIMGAVFTGNVQAVLDLLNLELVTH